MISEKDLDRILDRYLKGTATEQEIRLVEKWYSSLDAENNFPRLDKLEEASLHKKDLVQIKRRLGMKTLTVPLWPGLLKVAAVVLIGLALVYVFDSKLSNPRTESPSTATAQEEIINTSMAAKTILMPDSTRITLQPNSAVRFSKGDFNVHDRQVTLEGTASFAVSHDEKRPFRVFSYDVITTVLGTTFTIEAPSGKEKITVAVHTGRVSVSQRKVNANTRRQVDEIIVTPNQQAVFDPQEGNMKASLVPRPMPLRPTQTSKVVFDEEPITNILLDIRRSFGVDIEYDAHALRTCKITTAFSDEGLYERLNILTKAIDASYSIEGTKITFQSDGCATH